MTETQQDGDSVVRAFVAVELSPEVRAALEKQMAALRRVGAHVSWTVPENLHITLVFLGDITREAVLKVSGILDEISGDVEPFEVECGGLGTFGSPRSPRIIWAGIQDGDVPLGALQEKLARRLRGEGFRLEDRPFHAHVTLGRVRSTRGVRDLTSVLASDKNTRFGRFRVDHLLLMRSRLGPSGATYSVIHESPMKGAKIQ